MDIVFYHKNCPDGWAAAYIAKKKYPEAKLIPLDHGADHTESLKECEDKNVLMVDFSLRTYQEMKQLGYATKSLTLLDHHRTAEQVLSQAIKELGTVREIILSNGKKAYIDIDDEEKLKSFSWSEAKHGGALAYAGGGRENSKFVYMHRLVMNATDNTLVDHINRNTLDNRKSNLRFATKKQNAANMDRGFGRKGVTQNGSKWIAQIAPDGKNIYLGTFNTIYEASKAYDEAATRYFGEFARRNFQAAPEPFPANVKIVFDMNRSGGGLAWDYLFGDVPRPWWVNYTEDRDLWAWKLESAKEVCAYMSLFPYTIEAWDKLIETPLSDAIDRGQWVQKQIDTYVAKVADNLQVGNIGGTPIAVSNVPYIFCSEVGNAQAKQYGLSLTWFERNDGKISFSLRGNGTIDVSEIAKKFDGGGHHNAAGFQLPIDKGRRLIDVILGRAIEWYSQETLEIVNRMCIK